MTVRTATIVDTAGNGDRANQSVLVTVPCGPSKIWDRHPDRGPARVDEAYIGAPFRLNRAYAERFGDAWVVLSAKYGFMSPDDTIPGPYEVTFKRPSTNPLGPDRLRLQIGMLDLERFQLVVVLGGHQYREVVEKAWCDRCVWYSRSAAYR